MPQVISSPVQLPGANATGIQDNNMAMQNLMASLAAGARSGGGAPGPAPRGPSPWAGLGDALTQGIQTGLDFARIRKQDDRAREANQIAKQQVDDAREAAQRQLRLDAAYKMLSQQDQRRMELNTKWDRLLRDFNDWVSRNPPGTDFSKHPAYMELQRVGQALETVDNNPANLESFYQRAGFILGTSPEKIRGEPLSSTSQAQDATSTNVPGKTPVPASPTAPAPVEFSTVQAGLGLMHTLETLWGAFRKAMSVDAARAGSPGTMEQPGTPTPLDSRIEAYLLPGQQAATEQATVRRLVAQAAKVHEAQKNLVHRLQAESDSVVAVVPSAVDRLVGRIAARSLAHTTSYKAWRLTPTNRDMVDMFIKDVGLAPYHSKLALGSTETFGPEQWLSAQIVIDAYRAASEQLRSYEPSARVGGKGKPYEYGSPLWQSLEAAVKEAKIEDKMDLNRSFWERLSGHPTKAQKAYESQETYRQRLEFAKYLDAEAYRLSQTPGGRAASSLKVLTGYNVPKTISEKDPKTGNIIQVPNPAYGRSVVDDILEGIAGGKAPDSVILEQLKAIASDPNHVLSQTIRELVGQPGQSPQSTGVVPANPKVQSPKPTTPPDFDLFDPDRYIDIDTIPGE